MINVGRITTTCMIWIFFVSHHTACLAYYHGCYQRNKQLHRNTRCFSSYSFPSGVNGAVKVVDERWRRRRQEQEKQHSSSSLSKTRLCLSSDNNNNDNNNNYSREVRLREEAESPFQKVRFFFYASIAGGAATSLAVSLARIGAASSGINPELMQESLTNAAIDIVGLVAIAFLFRNDLNAQEARLERASKGAELAKLAVRVSVNLFPDEEEQQQETTTRKTRSVTLASLRRGRGIEKRVVIAVAGNDAIQGVLKDCALLSDSLEFNDLLVVPLVLPRGVAPVVGRENSDDHPLTTIPDCVAFPVGNNWKTLVDDEAAKAKEQGVDTEKEGFCVILKKNGRVGQRTKGIFLSRMVGEVNERREMGMDVSNI